MSTTINLCITGTTSRLPAQRYASAALSARPFVCHKSLFYRNGWTIELVFWRGGFIPPIRHCVICKFRYIQKLGQFPLELFTKLQT